jgi:chromosome segregation ATPase
VKERDELISREAYVREEFENAKQAMQDWEVLAMNERSLRESLSEKEAELKEQLEGLKDEYERAARDRDQNNQAVEGLQKALQEVQNCESPRKADVKHTNSLQYEDPSSRNLSKLTNPKLPISVSKSLPPKNPRKQLWPPSLRHRRNSSARSPSRKKSKRRTC